MSDRLDAAYCEELARLPAQIDLWLAHIDRKDHELFLELLSRYHYLTEPVCQTRYYELIDLLKTKLPAGVELADVLFITAESSGYASGGDNVRADLRSRTREKVGKKQIIAAQSKIKREVVEKYKAVVFLDDIIGSGRTLWNEIERFCKLEKSSAQDGRRPVMFYSSIAPRREGIQYLEEQCKKEEYHVLPLLKDSWYEEPAFAEDSPEYRVVEKYEKRIDDYFKKSPVSFFMGFEKNRLLLSFYYNTPNNTLSTFWRIMPDNDPPFYRDQKQRRPSLDELKKTRQKTTENAYRYGMDKNRKQQKDG